MQRNVTVFNRSIIRKSSKWLKNSRIGFVSPKPQAGGNIQRQLVTSVRNATTRRPSVLFQRFQCPHIFNQAVTKGTIKLEDIPIGSHTSVTNQVSHVLNREEILSCCHGAWILASKLSLQLIIERIAGLFVPPQLVGFKCVRVGYRRL
jgi:hypothetical protein